jgi:bis(5'-nucleosyl)-tetraphosphatase (symmetrical)
VSDYAIGDIQGCYDSLQALLAQIRFDRRNDRVWLTGDLVNRGPKSLEVLRWASDLGDRAIVVLGNHDLHLLAIASGAGRSRAKDTLDPVLVAPDHTDLIDWLRQRSLFHREGGFALVHAGLIPPWTIDQAVNLAGEVETALRGPGWAELLAAYRSAPSPSWRDDLTGDDRRRAILTVMTRIRTCSEDGVLNHDFAGPPDLAPPGFRPWYAYPSRASRDATILFGHWAAGGYRDRDGAIALDSGCVWGNQLTAVRLEDRAVFQQRAID